MERVAPRAAVGFSIVFPGSRCSTETVSTAALPLLLVQHGWGFADNEWSLRSFFVLGDC